MLAGVTGGSMIVHNLYIVYASIIPYEAKSPFAANPQTILSFPVSFELFKVTSWNRGQVFEDHRR